MVRPHFILKIVTYSTKKLFIVIIVILKKSDLILFENSKISSNQTENLLTLTKVLPTKRLNIAFIES